MWVLKKDAESLITIRLGEPNDFNFILATWLRGLYYGNSWFKEIDKDTYMKYYHIAIDNILKKKSTGVCVAVLREDKDVILGYSVMDIEQTALHWVYVKWSWRRMGIGRDLIPRELDKVTHLTAIGNKLKPQAMKFNPFIL